MTIYSVLEVFPISCFTPAPVLSRPAVARPAVPGIGTQFSKAAFCGGYARQPSESFFFINKRRYHNLFLRKTKMYVKHYFMIMINCSCVCVCVCLSLLLRGRAHLNFLRKTGSWHTISQLQRTISQPTILPPRNSIFPPQHTIPTSITSWPYAKLVQIVISAILNMWHMANW